MSTARTRPFTARQAGVLALALVLVAALGYWLVGDSDVQTTDDAFVSADFTLISPKVSGFVGEILVDDNQPVKAGQLLARIDNQDYQADLDAARAHVATATAQLANSTAALQRQQSLIGQARALVDADSAEVSFAGHEWQRYQNLAGEGAGTLQNAQQATSRFATAKARLAQHQAALEAARQQIEVLRAGQDGARATLQNANALQARAELNLSYTELFAPYDGTVGHRSVRLGAYVKPGDTLMAVVPLEQAYVVANFREVQLTSLIAGQPVDISVDTFPGQTLHGRVSSIAPATGVTFAAVAPDNATGNFTKVVQRIPVKVRLEPDQPLASRLRVGMSVQARVSTRPVDQQVSAR